MGILQKGTLVRHGTISSLLPKILTEGLRSRGHIHKYRNQTEVSPVAAGVYVGGLLAYNAAYLSFADAAKQLSSGELGLYQGAIPVVLEIELEEDCRIVADEDFVMLEERDSQGQLGEQHRIEFERRVVDDAQAVWDQYRTASIIRDGGIPAGWIRRVEFPEVKLDVTENMERDANLFALACFAHRKAFKEDQTLAALSDAGGKFGLTNSAAPVNVLYRLKTFSVYKDEIRRAQFIAGFHSIVGIKLDGIGIPQIYS